MLDSNSIHFGRNADNEDPYVRCAKCGFINNLNRRTYGTEGSRMGWGLTQPNTLLNGTVTAGDATITVDSTTGFSSSGYIYIFDTGGAYSSSNGMNKVAYTGTSSTTFTGCTGAIAHDDDMVVRGEQTSSGCSLCGTYLYNKGA